MIVEALADAGSARTALATDATPSPQSLRVIPTPRVEDKTGVPWKQALSGVPLWI
jgi:hypothetical protein